MASFYCLKVYKGWGGCLKITKYERPYFMDGPFRKINYEKWREVGLCYLKRYIIRMETTSMNESESSNNIFFTEAFS